MSTRTEADPSLVDLRKKPLAFLCILVVLVAGGVYASTLTGGDGTSSGLVSEYRFDTGAGDTAYDTSNSNDMSINGASWVQGAHGKALDFDGSDDTATTPINYDPAGAFAVSYWIKPDTVSSRMGLMEAETNSVFRDWYAGSSLDFWWEDESGTAHHHGTYYPNWEADKWHNVIFVYNGSHSISYINGERYKVEQVGSVDPAPVDNDFKIGDAYLGYFDGGIDGLRLYSLGLSPSEVKSLHNLGDWRIGSEEQEDSSLALDMDFQTDNSTHVLDTSGNSNHGLKEDSPVQRNALECQVGRCYEFDGSNDLNLGDTLNFEDRQDYTVSFWIVPGAYDGSYPRVISNEASGDRSGWDILRSSSSNSLNYERRADDGSWSGGLGISYSEPGKWHHFAYTFNGGSGTGYLDGREVTSTSSLGDVGVSSVPLKVGSRGTSSGSWDGKIDELKIHSRTLSDEEVWELYSKGREHGSGTGLMSPAAQYRFDGDSEKYVAGVENSVSGWTQVDLTRNFNDPVVIATGQEGADVSMNIEASRPVIRNVNSDSFEVRVMNDSQMTVTEDVGYVVMEKGHHTIDGVEVEAGEYSVSSASSRQTVSYSESFPSNTVVADSLQTECENAVTSRYYPSATGSNSFDIYWEDFDGEGGETDWDCGTETAGYIAMERGEPNDFFESGIIPGCTADPGSGWCQASYRRTHREPVLLTNPLDRDGGDKTVVGRKNITKNGAELRATETRTVDAEQGHATNNIPWMVFESTRTVYDSKGSENADIFGAPKRLESDRGSIMMFDGSEDRVRVPDSGMLDMRNGITYSMWIKPTESRSLTHGRPSSYMMWQYGSDEIQFGVYSGGDYNGHLSGDGDLPLNEWTHVTGTYDGNEVKLFIDGKLASSSGPTSGTIDTGSRDFWIGYGSGWSDGYFKGQTDDVRLYPYALDRDQIRTVMNDGTISID